VTNYAFTVIYQILLMITPFVTTPYVSRILQPKGVGIDAYILSIVSLFLAFSMLGIPLYGSRQIAQMRDSKDLGKEFISIYIYQLTFSLISLIVYIIYVFSLNQNQVFYFIHIITFVAQAIDISWYFNGREENKKVAVRNIVVRIVSIILVFMLVKTTSDLWKYILINSVSLFVGQFIMWIHLLREIRFVKPQLENIMTHLKPIFVLFIPQINIQIYLLINRIVLGSISGEIQVGYFNQAYRIITLCLGIVTSLGTVLLPRMASEFSQGNFISIKKYAKGALQFVFLVSTPMIYGLIAVADNFVKWFFGDGYDPVANLIKILSPVIFFVGLATVFGIQILVSTNQQNKYTFSVTIGAILSFMVNITLVPKAGAVGTSIALLVAEGIGALIQMYMTRTFFDLKSLGKDLLKYNLICMGMYLFISSLENLLHINLIFITFFQLIFGLIFYFTGLMFVKDKFILNVIKKLKVEKNY